MKRALFLLLSLLLLGAVATAQHPTDELPAGPARLGAGRQFSAVNWLV